MQEGEIFEKIVGPDVGVDLNLHLSFADVSKMTHGESVCIEYNGVKILMSFLDTASKKMEDVPDKTAVVEVVDEPVEIPPRDIKGKVISKEVILLIKALVHEKGMAQEKDVIERVMKHGVSHKKAYAVVHASMKKLGKEKIYEYVDNGAGKDKILVAKGKRKK